MDTLVERFGYAYDPEYAKVAWDTMYGIGIIDNFGNWSWQYVGDTLYPFYGRSYE